MNWAYWLWKTPSWFHTLMWRITGWKPTITLPEPVVAEATKDRDSDQINWREYERMATGYKLMRFGR